MSRNSRLATMLVLFAAALPAAGCADYLNHRDTVALAAGDAVNANGAIETIDPWPRGVSRTTGFGSDAGRASAYLRSRNGSGSSQAPVTVNVATGGGSIGSAAGQ
jgi:hypothetical protein